MTRQLLFPLFLALSHFGFVSATCPVTSLEGSVLVLKACENGLAYGLVTEGKLLRTITFDKRGNLRYKSSVKNPDFDYKTGFRVALRHCPECLCGDFYLDWMHYRGHGCGNTRTEMVDGKGELFSGTWSQAIFDFVREFAEIPFGQANERTALDAVAKADIQVDLDTVRLGYGYSFCATSCLVLRPFWGVQLAYIDQDYALKNFYSGRRDLFEEQEIIFGELTEKIKLRSDFFGYGLQAGLGAEYTLGCNLSLRGSGAFSILKGCFDICQKDRYRSLIRIEQEFGEDLIPHNFTLLQKDRIDQFKAIADTEIALRWQTFLCGCRYLLALQVGWESHWYFGQNPFQPFGFADARPLVFIGIPNLGLLNPATEANRGHLGLSGWSFSASLYF